MELEELLVVQTVPFAFEQQMDAFMAKAMAFMRQCFLPSYANGIMLLGEKFQE